MDRVKSSLQGKVIVLFIGVFISIAIIIFLVQYFILAPSFTNIERLQGLNNLERIKNAIDSEFDSLKSRSWDYAQWTDTYEYVQNQNKVYEEDNLSIETLKNLGIHFLFILNDENEVVWGEIFDPSYENKIGLKDFRYEKFPQNHPFFQFEITGDSPVMYKTGIFNTEYGPLLFSSTPILRSDGSGPSRGTFVVAKFLSATFVEKLNLQLEMPVKTILPEDENFHLIRVNLDKNEGVYIESFENNLNIYGAYLDVNSRPAFIIETQYSREITEIGFAAIKFSFAMIVLSSLTFLSFQFFLLRQSVLAPIATLTNFTKSISSNHDFNKRIPIQRSDEIGTLIEGMNYMIGTIEKQTNLLMEMNAKLQVTSTTDGLTGIPNRRMFDEEFAKYWSLHLGEKKHLGLIIGDIDHFKLYNDAYGHQKGDECLTTIALTIQEKVTRPSDLIARYGGEEFVILLPNTDLKGTEFVAETIRKAVENLEIHHIKSSVSNIVTISLGVGSLIPSSSISPKEFFDKVDKALYQSKTNGRNQVGIAQV